MRPKTASGKFFTYPIKSHYKKPHNSLKTSQEKPILTHETASGVFYYKFRHYSAELGRWPSRDPIEEKGGVNLYAFVGNDPIGRWDYLGYFDLDKVIEILNKDPKNQWVVCCLAKRKVTSFDSYSYKQKHIETEEEKIKTLGGAYSPSTKEIFINSKYSDVEAASTLVQECMHARDYEYKGFGDDNYNSMLVDYKKAKEMLEKKKLHYAWILRREIAGRIYEEEWRIRNNLGTKKNIDGREHYGPEGARTEGGKVDKLAIEATVKRMYEHLLPENVTIGGSKWKKVRGSDKIVNPQVLDTKKLNEACKCKEGPYSEKGPRIITPTQ